MTGAGRSIPAPARAASPRRVWRGESRRPFPCSGSGNGRPVTSPECRTEGE